jgi:hypothetical protein
MRLAKTPYSMVRNHSECLALSSKTKICRITSVITEEVGKRLMLTQ